MRVSKVGITLLMRRCMYLSTLILFNTLKIILTVKSPLVYTNI
jgi:hypothetical protein